jgi:hypothetical protein
MSQPTSSTGGGIGAAGSTAGVIRPSTPEDGPAIAALVGGASPSLAPAALAWKYWQAPSRPRSFVSCSGQRLVAHVGLVPGTCLTLTGRLRFAHVIDWAADRRAAGAGLALMKYVGRSFDALFAVGGSSDTQRILPLAGFRPRGTVSGFVRPLRPLRVLSDHRRAHWRTVPRLARNILRTVRAPTRSVRGWSVRRLDADGIGSLSSTLPAPRADLAVMERTAGSLAHALACPIARTELYVAERDDEPRGYFLMVFVPGQARLADCWAVEPRADDWAVLVQLSINTAKRDSSVAEMMAWSSEPVLSQALTSCGFHRRHELPFSLRPSRDSDCRIPVLRIQPLDNDAAFMHSGRVELLA